MFEKLQGKVSGLFTLFQASINLAKIYLSVDGRKLAARHLLLADGYLQDIVDLLDESVENIIRQSGTEAHLNKFKEWKIGAVIMKEEIADLLTAMGLN